MFGGEGRGREFRRSHMHETYDQGHHHLAMVVVGDRDVFKQAAEDGGRNSGLMVIFWWNREH